MGCPAGSPQFADGYGTNACFFQPTGIAVDASGNVYVADQSNFRIRKITPSGLVTTVAGSSNTAGPTDGQGSNAKLGQLHGVAVDPQGSTLWIAGYDTHLVRKVVLVKVMASQCGAGFFNASLDSTICEACPAGSFCPSGSLSPTPCPVRFACPSAAMTFPVLCAAGQYCPSSGLTSSISCDGGAYCPSVGLTGTLPCPAGYFCFNATINPLICPVAFYCPANSSFPIVCPAGSYCDNTTMKAPAACPSTTPASPPASTSMSQCGLPGIVSAKCHTFE